MNATAQSAWDFEAQSITGKPMPLSHWNGKVALIVNTASQCGLTSQYKGLQELYDRYKDRGFVVLGFPSNQFGAQEPGSNTEIAQFCELNYGVSWRRRSSAVQMAQVHQARVAGQRSHQMELLKISDRSPRASR
jgi:glutathione peroxidase